MPLAQAHERQDKVLYMRAVLGMSWRQIMREVGYTSVGGTQQAYAAARRRNEIPDDLTTLGEILERRRFRQGVTARGINTALQRGDLGALASLLRASVADDTELAKLFGLNAPEKHEVEVTVDPIEAARRHTIETMPTTPVIEGELA